MFRISLRELLIFVAVAPVCLLSLMTASEGWLRWLLPMFILIVFASIIVAVADRGERQKFALAFALLAAGYYFVVTELGSETSGMTINAFTPLPPTSGLLPTSRLLGAVWLKTQVTEWVDPMTGKKLGIVDPAQPAPAVFAGAGFGPNVVSTPSHSDFMRIGHLWWALVVGYIGGRLASFIYVRSSILAKE